MTREEARNRKEIAEQIKIMQAFLEDETVETYNIPNHCWEELPKGCGFDWGLHSYRIKPKRRPFKNMEECWNEMLKHQPFGWVKTDCGYEPLFHVNEGDDFKATFETCTFPDGTPFGAQDDTR